jgi:hypothetical protein
VQLVFTSHAKETSWGVAENDRGLLAALGYVRTIPAQEAIFKIEGVLVPFRRKTNVVSDVLPGLTFHLKRPTPSEGDNFLEVQWCPEADEIAAFVQSLVRDLNAFQEKLDNSTAYDSLSPGVLHDARFLRGLKRSLQGIFLARGTPWQPYLTYEAGTLTVASGVLKTLCETQPQEVASSLKTFSDRVLRAIFEAVCVHDGFEFTRSKYQKEADACFEALTVNSRTFMQEVENVRVKAHAIEVLAKKEKHVRDILDAGR